MTMKLDIKKDPGVVNIPDLESDCGLGHIQGFPVYDGTGEFLSSLQPT